MVRIQFKHGCELPPFKFPSGWIGEIILDAAIVDTDEDIYEEGEEDGEHTFFPTLQRSTKVYILKTGLINDSQLKTLYYLPLFDSVAITLETGERLNMQHIQVEHEYPFDNKYQATATIRFDVGEVLTKTTCCKNMSKGEVFKTFETKEFTCEISGGEFTGYERAMIIGLDTYLDEVYQDTTFYSLLDAFYNYAAVTETQLASMDLFTDYHSRLTDFIAYLKALTGVTSSHVQARRYHHSCLLASVEIKCIKVFVTMANGYGIQGTLKMHKDGVYNSDYDVAIDTNDSEYSYTYDDIDDGEYQVSTGQLNVKGMGSCVRSWSLDGINYFTSPLSKSFIPSVICKKVWIHLEGA